MEARVSLLKGLDSCERRVFEVLDEADTLLNYREIINRVGLSKGSVYPALNGLVDMGVVFFELRDGLDVHSGSVKYFGVDIK